MRRNSKSSVQKAQLEKLVTALLNWFSQNARDLPWRRTHDPYAIWVSEIMLQQTQVKTVLPYWDRWMRALPTIQSVAKAKPAKLHKLWEGLGYYTRVRNLQKAAQVIVEKHGGKFPESFEDVLALPGIGRYTAGAICSIAFNQPTSTLDGNVMRVLTRIFGVTKNPREQKTNIQLWKLAEALVNGAASLNSFRSSRPKEAHSEIENSQSLLTSAATVAGSCSALNQSLMELGALICTPRRPNCRACPVNKGCFAFRTDHQEELPKLARRAAATRRHYAAFVVERRGCFLVRQRPTGVVNGHLWEFPNVEIRGGVGSVRHSVRAAAYKLGFKVAEIKPLCTIKHSITRYRITLDAYPATFRGSNSARPKFSGCRDIPPSELSGVWLAPARLRKLAFTAAHKKILNHLE